MNSIQASLRESSSHHDMTLCDRPWPLKAGMIEEVNLKNFMCHEVNFIMRSCRRKYQKLELFKIRVLVFLATRMTTYIKAKL